MSDPLAARFEALLEAGTPDWLDVHRRARRRSRRIWLIAAVAAVFLAIPTVAIALDPTILPWNSAAPASSAVVKNFAEMVSGAPPGMDPHAKPGEARKIPLDGGGTVWVAPAANGGFCELFQGPYPGGCDQTRGFPISASVGIAVRCGTHPRATSYRVNGHVIAKAGSTLELDFSDGTSVSLPALTWVGPPIDAGFFEYGPSNKPMTALVLRDPGGSLIEKETKVFRATFNTRFAGCRPPNG